MNCLMNLGFLLRRVIHPTMGIGLGSWSYPQRSMHYKAFFVPLIMRGPGIAENVVNDNPVSTIDLGPTFADYAETTPQLTPHGQSLRPVVEHGAERDFALMNGACLPVLVALSLQTVRTKTAKMTVDRISGAASFMTSLQIRTNLLTCLMILIIARSGPLQL